MSYHRESQSAHPAYLLQLSARDLARFGLLFMRDGAWRDEQILPSEWVARATATHSDVGLQGGFGYMWWSAPEGRGFPYVSLPLGSFSARGTGSQLLLVIPEAKTIIVHRTDTTAETELMSITDLGRLLREIFEASERLSEFVEYPN